MTTEQTFKNKINNICKTMVKAGVTDFKTVKIGLRRYQPGTCQRVFGKEPYYGTVINSNKGNGMMESSRDYYDVVTKGYNIKYNSGAYIKDFNDDQDVCRMNAEEFIIDFYHFVEGIGNNVFCNGKKLKGFKFDKKDMTMYLTID